jgi:hypothetical protein
MSRLIRALVIHLTAQHHTTYKALQTIEQELITINNNRHQTQQKISNSCTMPTRIIPEHEKTRAQFMIQQHLHLNELEACLSDTHKKQEQIQVDHLNISTTLKLLEKRNNTIQKRKQDIVRSNQQNTLDEWILLRREPT